MAASEVPVVSFDYAVLGDRESPMTSGQDEAKKDECKEDDADVKQATQLLVGCDAKSRVCRAIPVPQKGVDQDEWAVREGLRFLEVLGYNSVVLKSNQESSLGVVLKLLRTHRGDQTQTMTEHSPVGESKSNWFIEGTIQSVEGQIRTLRSAIEARIGQNIFPGGALFAWLVVHAANLINMYEVGKDGRTPYQRLKGRKLTSNMIEFGECVHFLPLKHLDSGKAEIRWRDGVFLGLKLTSGEKLVGTPEGVLKDRTVRRKLESER